MSELTPDTVDRLGRLARLDLTDEEKERFSSQLSAVVGYVEQLSNVPPAELKRDPVLRNVLADDLPRPAGDPSELARDAWLAAAPLTEDGYLVVRAVLSGEEGSA